MKSGVKLIKIDKMIIVVFNISKFEYSNNSNMVFNKISVFVFYVFI